MQCNPGTWVRLVCRVQSSSAHAAAIMPTWPQCLTTTRSSGMTRTSSEQHAPIDGVASRADNGAMPCTQQSMQTYQASFTRIMAKNSRSRQRFGRLKVCAWPVLCEAHIRHHAVLQGSPPRRARGCGRCQRQRPRHHVSRVVLTQPINFPLARTTP
jgi:hypothetical protein